MTSLATGQNIALVCGHPRIVAFSDAHDTGALFWCGTCDGMRAVRPRDREWVPTAEVREGDQLAHKLSDTPWTYTTVTGWSDKYLPTSGITHRTFTVTGAPWWVRADNFELVSDLASETLIKRREPLAGPVCESADWYDTCNHDRSCYAIQENHASS
jgi:hypothetical protein